MSFPPACFDRRQPSRRHLLRGLAAAIAAAAVAPGRLLAAGREPRDLSFINTHTHERLALTYFADGTYDADSLAALDWFLRDHRTGDHHPIDPALFDLLYDLRVATGTTAPYQVISGYRSPRTNGQLREKSRGVASGSLHMQGRAIDVRLADVRSSVLRDAGIRLRRGGVGYYAASDFVHIDTGRFRTW
jgi:uncharacterized protein YcbK (DUF882 family)